MKRSFPHRFSHYAKALLICAAAFIQGQSSLRGQDIALDPATAVADPDKFNWTVFVSLCRKAPESQQAEINAGGSRVRSNNAIWETWADNEQTFPNNPNPANPPQLGGRVSPKKAGESGLERLLRAKRAQAPGRKALEIAVSPTGGGVEEVRRNKAAFDYIMNNGLYSKQGLAKFYATAVGSDGYPTAKKISFPTNAIEVKGDWAAIDSTNPLLTTNNCHWNYDDTGKLWGLIGFHIMTKALPNWTWATFEWVGNPTPSWQAQGACGRSDWLGTRDTFGYGYALAGGDGSFQTPIFINGQPSGKPYPGGKISTALQALFKSQGYSGEWMNEWTNYRLKGSQIDFTDATGSPTMLGNSSTEGVLAPNHDLETSSCITCHAISNTSQTGGPGAFPDFVTGPVSATNFYNLSIPLDTTRQYGGYKVVNVPLDFVWSFLNAK